jgi:hypothetical protein
MPRVPAQIRLEGSTNTHLALAREAWAASHRARHKVLVPAGQPSCGIAGKRLKSSSPLADSDCMSRKGAFIVVVAVALVASAQAAGLSRSAVPRGKAERNVLRFLARGWGHHRLPRLVDPRTHLLRNNTQAICRRARGQRAGSFVCVVRPARHRPREGLYLSYRSLDHGRFRIHWLYYRRG